MRRSSEKHRPQTGSRVDFDRAQPANGVDEPTEFHETRSVVEANVTHFFLANKKRCHRPVGAPP